MDVVPLACQKGIEANARQKIAVKLGWCDLRQGQLARLFSSIHDTGQV